MYEQFYGLSSRPFQLTPDPEFYFASTQHRRAQAYLDYGVMKNEGFVVVTGEVGAGKTTVVRGLLSGIQGGDIVAAQIVTTQLNADDLLRSVGAAFGIRVKGASKSEVLMALEVFLVSQAGRGNRCLLVVDEAQNLGLDALEELRMLSNFQFGKNALLQSFLIGQPEFRETLNHPRLLQLRQRIIAACHIGALDITETREYVEHRIKKSGGERFPVDGDGFYDLLLQATAGIPRNINIFCDRLLLQGYLENRQKLTVNDILKVKDEFSREIQIFDRHTLRNAVAKLVEPHDMEVPVSEKALLDDSWNRSERWKNNLDLETLREVVVKNQDMENSVLKLAERVRHVENLLNRLMSEKNSVEGEERFQ